jgi:hypothetical protein
MGQLLNRSILFIILSVAITSCGFHVVKNPGPQISWSVVQAKENKTFICSYKLKDSINGIKIESIFAERKYSSDGGFFSKIDFDCCESQLVFVSVNHLASEGTGFGVKWSIPGFNLYSSYLIYKDFKGVIFPDSIPISVVSIKDKQIIEKHTLYKIKR